MADRFWVGGSGNWSDNTNHWSATTGGAPGASKPTSADNVIFNTLSNLTAYTATVDETANCADMTFSAPLAGNATFAGSSALNIFGSLTMYAGLVNSFSGNITFSATSTGKTITTATTALGSAITFDGVGGGWSFSDAFTQNKAGDHTVASVTLTRGTLDMNGQTVVMRYFSSSNSNTRVLTLGAANVTLNGQNTQHWNLATTTGLTFNANTSTITVSHTSTCVFEGGGLTYNNVVINVRMGLGLTINGNNTFANLTLTGLTDIFTSAAVPSIGGNWTITNLFTVTGFSLIIRICLNSSNPGTTRTITAASVSLSNTDFIDITAAGAAGPFTGTSLGDGGGNTNITFTSSVTRYAVAGGNWRDTATWSATSGGSGGASVPICHDDVVLNAASGAITVNSEQFFMGKNIDCSGFTGTLARGTTEHIFGSFTLNSTMGYTTGGAGLRFRGRGIHTITSAGKTMGGSVQVRAPSGSYTLADAFISSGQFEVDEGSFDSAGFSMSCTIFQTQGVGNTRSITLGASTVTLTGTASGVILQTAATSGALTTSYASSTFIVGTTSTNSRTLAGGNAIFGTFTYTVAGSTGALVVSGDNTFSTFNFSDASNARTLTFNASQVNTIGAWNVNGVSGALITLSSSSGTNHTLTSTAGKIFKSDYLSISDSTATGGLWYAGRNSTDAGGGNSGWFFMDRQTPGSNILTMGVG